MKAGFVGTGNIARQHLACVKSTQGVQLVAVCDKNELRASEFSRQFGVPSCTDLAQMVANHSPDVIHILTPPQTHAALAIQALHAGCHVLVEKPLCLARDQADAIYAAAESTGRLVSVDHNHLWSPLVQRARRVIESGCFGSVLHVYYVMGDDYLDMVKHGQARWALEMRGGALCDLIPHALYIIRSFLRDVRVVSARARGTGIDDLHELSVDFASSSGGAALWMSLRQRPLEHSFRIYCSKGTIHVDLRNFCLSVIPDQGLPGPAARVCNTVSESWQRGAGTLGNAFRLLWGGFDPRAGTRGAIHAFYRAIAEGAPPPISREDAISVVELSSSIWDSLEDTPGAVLPAFDERGVAVMRRAPTDFLSNGDASPPDVLVTGGTGFIGQHLVRRLIADGQKVRVLCRDASRLGTLPKDGVDVAFGDVSDVSAIRRAMEGIETVYHLAATMNGDWAAHYQGTVVGSQNVLQAASEAHIRKMVFLSSLSVLHASRFSGKHAIDESFPLEPRPEARGSYSRAKLEAERTAVQATKDGRLGITIIRPGLVYGPGNADFLGDAGFRLGNALALVVGFGGRRLALTYVANLVDALCLAAQNGDSNGKIYHIVDPDSPTIRQYVKAYAQAAGRPLTALYFPTLFWRLGFSLLDCAFRLSRGSSPNLSYRLRSIANSARFDTTAARKGLGWQARVSFQRGIEETLGTQVVSTSDDTPMKTNRVSLRGPLRR
ncbi:MAG: Gfo/Idh/MocA family oxidoreductase [Chloroflexi bacterium]|nr:Gfo/Idh/MocA family oxidoreductase [Chloroflexota bacterium]